MREGKGFLFIKKRKNKILSRNISGKVKAFVFERDKGKCVYCGSAENLEFDHIIPASKGGSNTERNIQLVCSGCNHIKYNYLNDDDILEKKSKKKKPKSKRVEEIIIPKEWVEKLTWKHNDDISVLIENGKEKMTLTKDRISGFHTKVSINQNKSMMIKIPLSVMFSWLFDLKKNIIKCYIKEIGKLNGQPGLFLYKKED